MQEIFKLLIGVVVLVLAFPIGDILSKKTKEELKEGKKWFKIIVYVSLVGGVVGMFIGDDVLMFSFLQVQIIRSATSDLFAIKTLFIFMVYNVSIIYNVFFHF